MDTQNVKYKMSAKNFRLFLQQELIDRCRRNSKYSLRSFARTLGIGPSALSDMLNGKRTITLASIEKLGLALGLNPQEISHYQRAIKKTNDSIFKQQALLDFQQLSLDTYSIISDWYHYAILELMKLKDFKNETNWIAKSLGITKSEANAAVERLVRVGLILINKNGRWTDTSSGFSTNIIDSKITSAASKKLQKQILEMSINALENLPADIRNHTSMTMAINIRDLPEAINKIKEFRRELCAFLERNDDATHIYQLGLSLFPINNNHSGENL